MKTLRRWLDQKFDGSVPLVLFAIVLCVSVVAGAVWLGWWLINHIAIV